MARPGLTIALLLTTPALVEACQQWLPESRYDSVELIGRIRT
ncbi:MAG: circadian clock protein KaiA, partial [Cyanobacteria bacterium]|nr:circadian clock protein KaiA [Cyanobacteriota bacterium]